MPEKYSTKICNNCNIEKQLNNFREQHNDCKICENLKQTEYKRTKSGYIANIYGGQLARSRKRNHGKPEYTLKELIIWSLNQLIFHELFEAWEKSGYEKMLSPSFDRTDDYQGYCLSRLQIMTWRENEEKGKTDRRNGINNKHSKPIIQMTSDREFIKEYFSAHDAERKTDVPNGNIIKCCRGKLKSAGGFKWSYA